MLRCPGSRAAAQRRIGIQLFGTTAEMPSLGVLTTSASFTASTRPCGAGMVSMTGKRLDHYSATTINHRLAALTGLFTFRTLREPELRNPIPSGREARRVSAEERDGPLGHLVRPKRRSALRLR